MSLAIFPVSSGKKRYLELLLLGDEQESMIDRYLDRGDMYALADGEVRAVCVVTDEGGGLLELKNLAVAPAFQRQGYGRALIDFLVRQNKGSFSALQAGTGDSPLTVGFYEKCGFRRAHVIKDFFLENYDHPIIEAGVPLREMIYFILDFPSKKEEQHGNF